MQNRLAIFIIFKEKIKARRLCGKTSFFLAVSTLFASALKTCRFWRKLTRKRSPNNVVQNFFAIDRAYLAKRRINNSITEEKQFKTCFLPLICEKTLRSFQ